MYLLSTSDHTHWTASVESCSRSIQFDCWDILVPTVNWLQNAQTGSEVHLDSFSMGTGASFAEREVAEAWS